MRRSCLMVVISMSVRKCLSPRMLQRHEELWHHSTERTSFLPSLIFERLEWFTPCARVMWALVQRWKLCDGEVLVLRSRWCVSLCKRAAQKYTALRFRFSPSIVNVTRLIFVRCSHPFSHQIQSLEIQCLHTCIPGAEAVCYLSACTSRFDRSCQYCVNRWFWLFLLVSCKCQLDAAGLCDWEKNLWKKIDKESNTDANLDQFKNWQTWNLTISNRNSSGQIEYKSSVTIILRDFTWNPTYCLQSYLKMK